MNMHVTDIRTLNLELPRPVDQEIAGDIEKESVFVSPHLERIVVEPDLRTARLTLRPGAPLSEVVDKATRYLAVMSKQISGFDPKIFFENKKQDSGPYESEVEAGLVARGWMHDYGKGQVAYSGPVLKLARLINDKAGELYSAALGARDGHFPALISAEALHKCGYFDSHPNAVTFIGNIIEDFDALEEFRRANSCSEGALLPPHDHIHVDGMCLNPAACFPCYPSLSGRTIASGECYSWLGRVFRYESRNISGLDRL
jgi:hypothetical protein